MAKEKPVAIRVEVAAHLGDAYDGKEGRQWVERRQRVSGKYLRQLEGLSKKLTDEEAFQDACKVLSKLFTDWTLEGDDGPLPKPWKNSKAFQALYDSDFTLLVWVSGLVFLSVGDLLDQKN